MHLSIVLDMAAEGTPGRVLLGSLGGGWTGEDLRRRARSGAALLRDRGADALVYLAENSAAFPLAVFASTLADVPVVPLRYRADATRRDQLLARHPRAMVVAEAGQGLAPRGGSLTPAQWLAACAQDPTTPPTAVGDRFESAAAVIYTSGSTAEPKGVLLRQRHLASYVLGSAEFASSDPDDAVLVCVPPYHVAGVASTISNLYIGRRAVALGSFDAEEWVRIARAERITHAFLVPTMLSRILEVPGHLDVPALRAIAYGGAKMPADVIRRAMAAWPQVDFTNAYGLTETSSTISVLTPGDHRAAFAADELTARVRLESAGRPLPSVEVEVRDEQGHAVGRSVPGRIFVRGDQVSGTYTDGSSGVDAQGYFDTRDDGYLDAAGYLFVIGRADDTIIRGGENIAPAEVEACLTAHPAVREAVVVGVPDAEWGQRLEAVVTLASDQVADPEALREHVRASLRGSKTPAAVHIWPAIPRTEMGKLVRRDVVRMLKHDAYEKEPR